MSFDYAYTSSKIVNNSLKTFTYRNPGNHSVSFLNISNILQSTLVSSCIVRDEQIKELDKESNKDRDLAI